MAIQADSRRPPHRMMCFGSLGSAERHNRLVGCAEKRKLAVHGEISLVFASRRILANLHDLRTACSFPLSLRRCVCHICQRSVLHQFVDLTPYAGPRRVQWTRVAVVTLIQTHHTSLCVLRIRTGGQNFAHRDLFGRPCQLISSAHSLERAHQPLVTQVPKNFPEKRHRDFQGIGNFARPGQLPRRLCSQVGQGLHGITRRSGEHGCLPHRRVLTPSFLGARTLTTELSGVVPFRECRRGF